MHLSYLLAALAAPCILLVSEFRMPSWLEWRPRFTSGRGGWRPGFADYSSGNAEPNFSQMATQSIWELAPEKEEEEAVIVVDLQGSEEMEKKPLGGPKEQEVPMEQNFLHFGKRAPAPGLRRKFYSLPLI